MNTITKTAARLAFYAFAAIGWAFCVAAIVLSMAQSARAQERYSDPDKRLHFAAGAIIGTGVTLYTKSALSGAAAGCAVGVLKEAYDKANPPHTATAKDAIATCAGAIVGAGTGWVIRKDVVAYEFRW